MKNYQKRYLFLCCIAAALCTLFTTCGKEVPEGRLPDGYIALTFDDSSVGGWYANLPMMESFGIKATFYISSYHALTTIDKRRLVEMKNRGHEIAYHTTNHKNLLRLLDKEGWSKVNEEINTDLELMRRDGFELTDFAYPYGRHDAALDRTLLKTFKTVRALTNKTNYYQSLASEACEKQVLYAANVDVNTKLADNELVNLITKAKDKKTCLVLVAHQINNPNSKNQITTDKIKFIADKAKELNLQFITIDKLH